MYNHQYEALKRHVHFYLDAEEGPLAGRTELHVEDFKVSEWVLGGSRQLLEDVGLAGVEVQKDYHSEGLGLKFMKDGEQIGSAMVSTDVDAMLDADLFEGEDFEDEDPAEIDRTNMTISDYYVHEIRFLRPDSGMRPIRWDEMDGLEGQARKHREFDPDKFSQYMDAIRLEDFSYTDENGKEVDAKHGYGIWLNETGCEISAQDACSGTLKACQAMADIRFPGDFPGKAPTVQMGGPGHQGDPLHGGRKAARVGQGRARTGRRLRQGAPVRRHGGLGLRAGELHLERLEEAGGCRQGSQDGTGMQRVRRLGDGPVGRRWTGHRINRQKKELSQAYACDSSFYYSVLLFHSSMASSSPSLFIWPRP